MWIRVWFADGDKRHQRGYTLVDPDPAADTVDVDFALHDGVASRWAQEAQPGDTIEATVLGSNLTLPEPRPAGYVIVGDTGHHLGGPQERRRGPGGGGQLVGVRRVGSLRLGRLRQPHHPRGGPHLPRGLQDFAQIG